MNNEDKILAMLTQIQTDLTGMRATQTAQGEHLTALTEKVNGMDNRLENVEDMQSEVCGSVSLLTKKVEGMDNQLDNMDIRLKGMENQLAGVDTQLDSMEARLVNVETRLVKVETGLVSMESRLNKVKFRLDNVDAKLEKVESMQEELRVAVDKVAVKIDEQVIPYVRLLDEDYIEARRQPQLTERVVSLENNVKMLESTALIIMPPGCPPRRKRSNIPCQAFPQLPNAKSGVGFSPTPLC